MLTKNSFILAIFTLTLFLGIFSNAQAASTAAPFPTINGNRYWRVNYLDEFRGVPEEANPFCYSGMPPQCLNNRTLEMHTCEASSWNQLSHLNKCVWTVFDGNCWMSPHMNQFDARAVEVRPNEEDGVLVLRARGLTPGNQFVPSPLPSASPVPYPNCATGSGCPVATGAVISRVYNSYKTPSGTSIPHPRGLAISRGGRVEARVKLARAPIASQAIWMIPQGGSYLGWAEIDLLEADGTGDRAYVTNHSRYYSSQYGAYSRQTRSAVLYPKVKNTSVFADEYHVYAAEWDERMIRYFIDGALIQTLGKDIQIYGTLNDSVPMGRRMSMQIPPFPMTFFLTLAVGMQEANGYTFQPFETKIDYIRTYFACEKPEEFCPNGGQFNDRDGRCHALPPNRDEPPYSSPCTYATPFAGTPLNTHVYDACVVQCPSGAWWNDGTNCVLAQAPNGFFADYVSHEGHEHMHFTFDDRRDRYSAATFTCPVGWNRDQTGCRLGRRETGGFVLGNSHYYPGTCQLNQSTVSGSPKTASEMAK